jgi:type II secretory ATPase GspE/PulE/Tfp pilus assembly ATPase PilB-like protein/nucleotide-binding universal stress UspA family protein
MAEKHREILVATDFSGCSVAAVAQAAREAMDSGGRLHLVHVLPSRPESPEVLADERRWALERLAQCLPPETELALHSVKEVVVGQPAHEIVGYAREHANDLIVLGTHGRTGLARLALGSVAQQVLRDAPCEVSVVRANDPLHPTVTSAEPPVVFEPLEPESPAIDLIERARQLNATDIHVDPIGEATYSVRLRIDGRLVEYSRLEESVAVHLINRLKTLGSLDFMTPFKPLEGRLRLPSDMEDTEVRITTAPVAGGEAVSLRLLVRSRVFLPLEHLGLSDVDIERVRGMIRSVEGLVVVTGPTGSGKTTFAYSMLESLASMDANRVERNMVSIEDPVELAVPFLRQISTNPKQGITFASGLKTILRMDPDVIFVGEVRDRETATVAMQAANSGRYVVSTMHARSVVSTVTALIGMGLERRLLAANLSGVVNARLARRLCLECRRAVTPDERQREAFAAAGLPIPDEVFVPHGCDSCRRTGYRNSIGLFEVATITADVREVIVSHADDRELERAIRATGARPLRTDALEKVAAGIVDFRGATEVHWLA